jgi:very-short-patch-repair endonuclease
MADFDEERRYLPGREFRRALRSIPTSTEEGMWRALRKERTGYRFTRQFQIGEYFADFCCRARRVVVELDGSAHVSRIEEDEARDEFLRAQGCVVLRFSTERWITEPEIVLEEIAAACAARPQFRY